MTDFDDKLKQALRLDENELLDSLAKEQSLTEKVAESFRGRQRWLVVLVYVFVLASTGLGIFCLVKMLAASDPATTIRWAAGLIYFAILIAMSKIWYWMELNRNSLAREVKRLELEVALMSRQLGDGLGGEKSALG